MVGKTVPKSLTDEHCMTRCLLRPAETCGRGELDQDEPWQGLVLRFYAPKQAYFDKTWQLNDIE